MAEVGIRDVAAYVGVSIATVSNALHRPYRVSKETVARVMQAIDELGYVPNVAARQLRAGRSGVLGMAVHNLVNPFFSQVVLGVEEVAERSGYSLIVGNSYASREREVRYLELFERLRLDGILIAPVGDDLSGLDLFSRRRPPVVLVDQEDPTGVYPSVSLDDVHGGGLAAQHLLAAGARHIAFVGGPLQVAQIRDRLAGCRQVVEAAGARFTEILTPPLTVRSGREVGDRLAGMAEADRPDGVFVPNDEAALGVLQSLISRRISVPGEIAIVGYDDIDFAAAAIVPLTSVRQPAYEMGARAAEMVLQALSGEAERLTSVRFEPELVARRSTHELAAAPR